MPAKARLAVAACEEWHAPAKTEVYIGQTYILEPRKTYDDLLPQRLNLDQLQEVGNVALSQEHREKVIEGFRALVQDVYREHEAQPAEAAKKEYAAVEHALKEAYRAAGQLGADAAINLELKLKAQLGIDRDLFDLLGLLRMLVRFEAQALETAKQHDVVRDLVRMYLPIFEEAGAVAGISATGPFVNSIEILNRALPDELRAAGCIGNRVKKAVKEMKAGDSI